MQRVGPRPACMRRALRAYLAALLLQSLLLLLTITPAAHPASRCSRIPSQRWIPSRCAGCLRCIALRCAALRARGAGCNNVVIFFLGR